MGKSKSTLGRFVVGRMNRVTPLARRVGKTDRRCDHRRLPVLEGLEDRTVLSPTIYTVNSWGDSPADPQTATTGDLRYCIGLANANTSNPSGSLIQFDPTVFNVARTITAQTALPALSNVTDPIAISGTGISLLTVSGRGPSSTFSVFTVNSKVTVSISGLTISNGNGSKSGPGLNPSSYGGGVNNSGNLSLTNVTISNNNSADYGGGVYSSGTATLTNVTFSNNSAGSGGGMDNCGTATLTNVTFSNNSAGSGGGICSSQSVFFPSPTVTLINDTFSGNTACEGGGVYVNGTATLTNVTISGNSATAASYDDCYGGGVYNGGTATLTNVTISGNSASKGSGNDGGGVYNGGTATLTNVTLSGNKADSGGGVYNDALATLSSVTLSGNSATDDGGGIDNTIYWASESGGTATLTNVTLSGNSATDGGGVYNDSASTATLTNATLSGNSATKKGGGVYNTSGTTVTLTNGIVAQSTSGGAISGSIIGYNVLVDDAANAGGLTNGLNYNIVGVNPLLGTLGNYGGPTQTVPLLPGSPAIDSGSTMLAVDGQGKTLTTDQRGLPRVVGAAVDMGAFESSGFTLTASAGNNQSTIATAAFPTALQVTVAPVNAGDPVNGGTITFTAPPASGASATLAPASPATITGGSASVNATANKTAGGPYTVTASTAGAATPASFSLTNAVPLVSSLSIVPSATSPTYGQSLTFTVTAAPSGTGAPVPTGTVQFEADGVDLGAPVTLAAGSATSIGTSTLSAGSRTITALYSGDSTYQAQSASISLVVSKAHLTVTADAKSMLYGASLPALTATISGFVNGDKVTVVSGSSSLSTTATASSPVGAYTITVAAGTLSAANYDFPNLASGTLTVNKAHLKVTADAQSMLYGGSVPTLTATISGFANGDTVSVVSGSAALSTTAKSSSPLGNYPITVTAGTLSATNYDFPTLVNGTLTINKAHLTVTADAKSMLYGGSVPTLTATISGFVNGDTVAVVKGSSSLSTTAKTSSPAGTYTITVAIGTLSATNYDFPNLVNGTLTINKAHLKVTADAQSMLYGASLPTLTATISGFVNGDKVTVVSGSSSLSTTATASSPVGAYPITVAAGTLSAANYDFPNLVNGTLTISKAHLTLTASSLSKIQGTSNPALTYVITGFVNGENATTANVTGTPNLSTTAVTTSPPGSYPITITAGTLAAQNYDIPNLVNGTLTVSAAGQTTVLVGSTLPSSTYGQTASFTVTVSPSLNGPTPTGQVQFLIDGAAFGSAVTLVNGSATSGAVATLSATTHLITANYSGDGTYPTNSGTYNQVVTRAHLTVTADAQSMFYGGTVPALTATITGFVNGDTATVVSGSAALSTIATSTSPVGVYPITVSAGSLSAANYDFPNLVNGSLAVTKAHLTVTGDAQSMLYGGSLPALTATISGFVNGDTAAVVSGSSSLSTTAKSSSLVGSYPITVSAGTLTAANYDFPSLVNGTLTINKAHLTVTADAKSKVYGAAVPPLTATISGFVNGDTAAVVSGASGLKTTATAASPVGADTITVTAGTLSAANYDFPNLVSGTLTINKAHLTVTANNKSKTQGNPNPPLTSTITGFVNGDSSAVVSGAAVLSTPATTSSPAGSYAITVTAGTLSAANYDFPNLVNGTLTVTVPLVAAVAIVPSLASPTYGQALTFTATVSPASPGGPTPGGAVQFQVDGVNLGLAVTLVNGAATSIATSTLGAGNRTVTAVYSGDSSYAGNTGSRGLILAKAHLTVSATASKIYGAAVPNLTPTFTGFVNGDTMAVVSGAAKLTTTATSKSNVGNYPITVAAGTLSAANYDFPKLVNGTLTVTKAHLTVTAVNKTRKQGAANPALTDTITGFVNGDKSTVVKGKPTLSTTAVKSSPAGSYPIVVALGTLSASNYDFTLVKGTLTVTGAKAASFSVAVVQAPDSEASPSPFERLIPTWWRKGLSRS